MNVKRLREVLAALDEDVEIVVGASDHSYRRADAEVVTAESDGRRHGYLGEYAGDENMTAGYKKVAVLYVG